MEMMDQQFEIDTLLSLMKEIDNAPMNSISREGDRQTSIIVTHRPDPNKRSGVTIIDQDEKISIKITDVHEDIYFNITKPSVLFSLFEPSFYREYKAFKKRMKNKFDNAQLIKQREKVNIAINKVYPNIADKELLE